ncbi:carboxylate-amine ligase [Pseudonocardia sp. Cha107L01]|uniref:carboxylate-amine ligase n=1 Tax=Pseudonocardia sp. Cha107L01 TaxID=3457576 RepID=UPI00403EDEFE
MIANTITPREYWTIGVSLRQEPGHGRVAGPRGGRTMELRTVGVEEEFLLVDPSDGRPRAIATAVLGASEKSLTAVEAELQLQQIETGTRPCRTLDELEKQVRSARRAAACAARSIGVEIAAMGTSPLPVEAELTPSPRYERLAGRFGLTAQEQLTCGCHVHVGVESDEEGVAVLDRIRPWLAPLLALSANSPFWQGEDSRYSSYRSQVWSRWPSAGINDLFGSARAYHDTVREMVASETVLDTAMVYFDARLSQRYPTIEVRVADVCLHSEDAVLIAALVRALVDTAATDWAAGREPDPVRTEVLKLAAWRAGRSGLAGELIDPTTRRPAPALAVLENLCAHVRDALEANGDYTEIVQLQRVLAQRGNGAQVQRAVYRRTGRLRDVVRESVRRTFHEQ